MLTSLKGRLYTCMQMKCVNEDLVHKAQDQTWGLMQGRLYDLMSNRCLTVTAWFSLCICLMSSITTICSPHNTIVKVPGAFDFKCKIIRRWLVSHLVSIWLAWHHQCIIWKREEARRKHLTSEGKQGGTDKRLKCLGNDASIWKAIDWATTAVWIAIASIYLFQPGAWWWRQGTVTE